MSFSRIGFFLCTLLLVVTGSTAYGQSVNEPSNHSGRLPKDENGRTLNLNFETGDLRDWTATGIAWEKQPIKGGIDPRRPAAGTKQSLHTGDYWIGGYERMGDQPQGTLSSVPFVVDAPWCSFLVGGGARRQTRAELVLADTNQVIATELGYDEEELHPVVLNLEKYKGKKIFIRLVDESSGGWGHLNFDDFRFYDVKPEFKNPRINPVTVPSASELYPFENLTGIEAAKAMQVPPGFQVQCAAQEPDVRQPIAMAIDDRGRVWVAEAFAYPQREEQGRGRDQILIFEDTDLDGILDKRTVFITGLNLVSGLEVGFGGVWVGAAPYLMFIPDRNENDIPDGLEGGTTQKKQPGLQFPDDVPSGAEVLLDGWAWQDTHEILNAFAWGPDGWLYGCHGIFTHSKVGPPGAADEDRVPINAGVWRYHPQKHVFEVFIHGTSNPWGIDWNSYGDAFCTACVIPHLYYLIPGGRYQRQAGAHFNLATYEDIKTIARHRHYVGNQWNTQDRRASDDVGGGHAHAGAMIYLGGAWPQDYDGKLFMHNIHGNRVNVDVLIPEGSGYAGDRNPDFLLTRDKWSQMIALQYGPDGQVWMIDWYDQQQCHRNEKGVHDRSNGRIYRVSYQDAKPVRVDLQKLSDQELVQQAIFAKNEWYARHARRILQERSAAAPLSSEALAVLDTVKSTEPIPMLRRLWLLNHTGAFEHPDDVTVLKMLGNPDPHVRSWGIRLLVQNAPEGRLSRIMLQEFVRLAVEDPSPVVRLALASAAQRLPLENRWQLLENLIAHRSDARDHNLPLMIWYAMEPLAAENPQRALALGMAAGESIPLLREFMIRRLGSGKPHEALQLLAKGLLEAKTDDVRLTFLKGMRGALTGLRDVSAPAAWEKVYPSLVEPGHTSRNFDVYLHALGLGARFGDEKAAQELRQMVIDEAGPVPERRLALSYLVENRDQQLQETVTKLLKGSSLRSEAIRAVASLGSPQLAQSLIDAYPAFSPVEQADARNTLASRAAYAVPLLMAVAANRIPKADLSADVVRQLRNLGNSEVNALLEKSWGVVRDSSAERRAQIEELTRIVQDPEEPPASRELGRTIFSRTCQQCHTLFGTGGKVGPDITGANRGNLNYLLSNIVDPSAVMAKEYQPVIIATSDGRVVTGIIKEENANAVTVQTANELVTIPQAEIEARWQSEQSMMPDGLLKILSPKDVRALIAYLSGPGQTAMQATPELAARLFQGENLQGWRPSREADGALWTVENGELIGRSPGLDHNTFLINELAFQDFRFRCDVKLVDNKGNSGIQFRSIPIENGEMKGCQADIGPGWWGKLYEEGGRGLLADHEAGSLVKPGDWNTYEILAIGSRVQTFLNGTRIVDRNDPNGARSGVLALQLHSGGPMEVRYRNLQVELLPPLPDYPRAGSPPGKWPASVATGTPTACGFRKTTLDTTFRSEGCCVADFDNDGDLDIATGSVWYEQPDASLSSKWKQHLILDEPKEFNPDGYSDSFMNYAVDLNDDGWLDLLTVTFPASPVYWFENPGIGPAGEIRSGWLRHLVIPNASNESPQYLDLNGDGVRELLSAVDNRVMAYSTPLPFPLAAWKINSISASGAPGTDRFSHGLGAGDINGDGRADVVITEGWWEQPPAGSINAWPFHRGTLGQPCSQMFVYDFNTDGAPDVLSSSAHRFGIWWHEQRRGMGGAAGEDPDWIVHQIDDSISQTHALALADLNGDGLPDFVTGRRHWAHNGHDPGEDQPAVLVWYEYRLVEGRPRWTRHLIDDNSGIGTQFEVTDVNRDGLLDIVTSNKKGTFLFEQFH
jgi:putative membrane-bound dehydrogenase-like protein